MSRSCYAALTELILTYKSPALSFAPETRTDEHIKNGYEMLLMWDHLPVMRRGLERTRNMMAIAGIDFVEPQYNPSFPNPEI
jgi:hypothetical protein